MNTRVTCPVCNGSGDLPNGCAPVACDECEGAGKVTANPMPAAQPSASLRCQSEASVILRSIRGDIEAAYNGLDYLTSIHVATVADPNGGRQLAIDAAEIKGRLLQHMKRIDAALAGATDQPEVCPHGIRWPWECHPCADAAWAAHKASIADPTNGAA